eukprot:7023971-Prymnesium_polylepis.2
MAEQEEAMRRSSLIAAPKPDELGPALLAAASPPKRSPSVPAFERLHALGPKPVLGVRWQPPRETVHVPPSASAAMIARSTTFARSAAVVHRGNGRSRDFIELLEQRQARIEQQLKYRQLCGLKLLDLDH